MNTFAIAKPRSFDEAARTLGDSRFKLPVLKAGGMDVVDHLKEGLLQPDLLVDVRRLRSPAGSAAGAGGEAIGADAPGSGLRIEATATLAEIAASPLVNRVAPVLAQAAGDAASPQVRNVATAAGNLLQRPRCWYYRNEQFDCLKKGGSTCFAVEGENRYHAIFGPGPCHIVHPSNLAVALCVTGGVVHILGVVGSRRATLAISELYHMPDRGILDEHELERGEVVTHITFDAAPLSGFCAIKEKQSFDWPLVMAAVALEMTGSRITSARVCAGAVAPVPWLLPDVEEALGGVSIDDEAALRRACAVAAGGAAPMSENAYKVKLLPVAIRRAVLRAAGREVGEARA